MPGRRKYRLDRHARVHRQRGWPPGLDSRSDLASLAIELPMLVENLESIGKRAERFRRAEEQHAALREREMEDGQDPLLRRRLEIDEQVAAGDEIDARERRIADHVVLREHD